MPLRVATHALALAAAASLFSAAALVAAPPNIVWIIADDMSPDVAAYGAKQVRTPHLDRLAAEGLRYERAYASAPVCSSSRSAFILGCYQTTTGLHAHDVENPQPLAAPYRPLTELLRGAGYFVTNAAAPGSERNGRPLKQGKTHYNFAHDARTMFDGDDWRKRRAGQPFFAQFQISEPHRPFPIPAEFQDSADDAAELAALELPANCPDHPLVRRDWFAYLRSVETVDRRVGAILDQLRSEGVLDDTFVFFFADHGRPMPWGKQWLTVEGLHVPLLVRGPTIPAGTTESRPVSLIDLAPTALRIAAADVPPWMEGLDLFGPESPRREVVFAARDRCGDAEDRIRAVITARGLLAHNFLPELPHLNWSSYKEASYPAMPLLRELQAAGKLTPRQALWLAPSRAEWEYYDLRSDPQGLTNVAADPRYRDEIAGLRQRLDDWIRTSGDRGALADPPTEPTLAEIKTAKRADYARVWTTRLGKPEPSDAERLAWWLRSYGLKP